MKTRRVQVSPDIATAVTICSFMIAMWYGVSALHRIADALERAHPAPEVGK